MILDSARAAAGHVFSPAFRGVFFKTIGLTVLVLVAAWFGLATLFDWLALPWIEGWWPGQGTAWSGWLGLFAAVAAGLGLALGLGLLIAPVTAVVAGLFLDDAAALVEQTDFPDDPPGRALPAIRSIVLSLKFLGVVILGNIVALLLLLVPGINIAAFFVVNGYLIGREYFEFAAMRFRPEEDARALRRAHAGTIFLAGLIVAALMAVPLLNLVTPLFACAMMVHLHKRIAAQSPVRSAGRSPSRSP